MNVMFTVIVKIKRSLAIFFWIKYSSGSYFLIFYPSFGIFMPKFKEHFGVGSAEISTVNSIQMGVTFASGEARKLEEI